MRLILRNTFLLFFALSGMQLLAQPANDDCGGALLLTLADDEASAVRVAGDTRGATASSEATGSPTSVCSGSWFSDDIWYEVTIPAEILSTENLVVGAFFNQGVNPTDIPEVGMGFYPSCDADATPWVCYSDAPGRSTVVIGGFCLEVGATYYVRIWSAGHATDFSGTLEVAAWKEDAEPSRDVVLLEETFADGLAGWTTFGECRLNIDSSVNAVWEYYPNSTLDKGSFQSGTIGSVSFCDGAVGVDSDFNDNLGISAFETGPVPTNNANPADYFLQSPVYYIGDMDVAGITCTWTEMHRNFTSQYFFSWRTRNAGEEWTDFRTVQYNTDIDQNENQVFSDNTERHFMPGVAGNDSLQIQFLYRANYYIYAIDDVKLVETEANNMRAQSNFFATAPYAVVPATEVRPYYGLIDIFNAGALTQTGVVVNHTVVQDGSGNEIYNSNLSYAPIGPDSVAENQLFPDPIIIPNEVGSYSGMYSVSADSSDFDDSDNTQSYSFNLSSVEYAHELGSTRAVAVANGVYDDGAPLSYAYGNVFSFPTGGQYNVNSVTWGVSTPADMVGFTVNIVLYRWIDTNGDEIAAFDEREILALADYTFIGDEGDNVILSSELENFENPGDPVTLADGGTYLVMVEYQAFTADDPQFFLLASEAIDFGAIAFAMDSAFVKGWVDYRTYITCLGVSADGNIAGIDYEVTELDVNDNRVFFGNDIVPVVRLNVQVGVSTDDPLPTENLISVYPNPASEMMNIKLEFDKPFEQVDLNVYDMKGQLILNKSLSNVQTQIETLDVRSLTAGTYMLKVVTEDGQRTQRFVVQQ